MSHWTMLKTTTMNGKRSRLTPASAIMTVKKSVDKPIMAAKVPINEKRSFHKLTKLSPIMLRKTAAYIIFTILCSDSFASVLKGVSFRWIIFFGEIIKEVKEGSLVNHNRYHELFFWYFESKFFTCYFLLFWLRMHWQVFCR
jgi:hypothetical protein